MAINHDSFDKYKESLTLNRLDEDTPFIMELTAFETAIATIVTLILTLISIMVLAILLSYFDFGLFGFAGLAMAWPIGKRIFRVLNDAKKGKPAGYLSHTFSLFLFRYGLMEPSFSYKEGSWEVDR